MLLLLTATLFLATPGPLVEHRVAGVSFKAPASADVTRHTLTEKSDAIVVTLRGEVLVLTLYASPAPLASRALRVHLEELERKLIKHARPGTMRTQRNRIRFMKRVVVGRTINYQRTIERKKRRFRAEVVARRVKGRTLVATWTAPSPVGAKHFSPKLIAGIQIDP